MEGGGGLSTIDISRLMPHTQTSKPCLTIFVYVECNTLTTCSLISVVEMPRSASRCSLLCVVYSQFLTPNIIPHRSHVCPYPVTFLAIIAAQYQYTIMLIPAQMEEQHVNRYQHLDQAAAARVILQSGYQIIFSYGLWFICIVKMSKNSRRKIVKCLKPGKNGQKQKRHCYIDSSSLILHRRVIGPHLWRNTTQCRRYGCNVSVTFLYQYQSPDRD